MKYFKAAAILMVLLITAAFIGCGETEETVETNENPVTMGSLKWQEEVPAAPQAPDATVPYVKSVEYFSDWKLTKPLIGRATHGITIYTKVVFSKPMRHFVADDKSVRPILYYKIDKKLVRYRMAAHGARGEDFASGDAKPLHGGTDDYICKYVVPADVTGAFTLAVGKFSLDISGKKLAAFYTHSRSVLLGKPPKISYYRDSNLTIPLTGLVEVGSTIYGKVVFSGKVPIVVGDTPDARPLIFFHVGPKNLQCRIKPRRMRIENLQSGEAKPYKNTNNSFICKYVVRTTDLKKTVFIYAGKEAVVGDSLIVVFFTPTSDESVEHGKGTVVIPGPRDFAGLVCVPSPKTEFHYGKDIWLGRKYTQPVPDASVTIMSGPRRGERVQTNRHGQYIFRNFREDEMHLLVEKEFFEPKEVFVYRSHPTTLPDRKVMNFYEDPQKNPGTILIGQAWPEEIRPILQHTSVISDLLYVELPSLLSKNRRGFYVSGVIGVDSNNVGAAFGVNIALNTIAHEIAHAHQHVLVSPDGSGGSKGWSDTLEGRAYIQAQKKDWKEVGKSYYDIHLPDYVPIRENMAETFAYWWSMGRWAGKSDYQLETTAPNRFKWAEMWLKKR